MKLQPLTLYPLTPEQAIRRAMSAPPLPLNEALSSRVKKVVKTKQKPRRGKKA